MEMSTLKLSTLRVLETNLDDLNPEIIPYVVERLLAAGAKDVWHTPIVMKFGRPGCLLSVLFDPSLEEALSRIVFEETSTLGVRLYEVQRRELQRSSQIVKTAYGEVQVKIARDAEGKIKNVAPEYSDCARVAADSGVPLKRVYSEALATYHAESEGSSD